MQLPIAFPSTLSRDLALEQKKFLFIPTPKRKRNGRQKLARLELDLVEYL